jgi:dTDP-4-amino-4,6-dideoxygalactose transaminase
MKDLAIFGGASAFQRPRSTSNLIKPNKQSFLQYMKNAYLSGQIGSNADVVSKFEIELASLHGAKYCIAVSNGLWGLVLTINELSLKGRNEIIMPSLTYRRMADIAAWLKMTPHFCDVDAETLGITPSMAEPCINENTALILAPHPIVNLCDVDGMIKLGEKYKIPVLFDSVEATYAIYKGKPIGSFGDAECFSVHASKFLNGFEGGYITTNRKDLADRLRAARNYGFDADGSLITIGINGGLISMHAAMTLACLEDLEKQIARNRQCFLTYKELLSSVKGIELVEYSFQERRSFKNILVRLNKHWPLTREETLLILQRENMVVRPYYYPPLHMKKTTYPVIVGNMTNTEKLMKNYMLLPCGEFVNTEDVGIIVNYLKYIEENAQLIKENLMSVKI